MIDLNHSRNLAARPCTGCFLALLILAGWLAMATPLLADNPPTYLFEIDVSAFSVGSNPADVALDTSNNIYVTTGEGVVKFARNGSYLMQWGSYGTNQGQLEEPQGIALDSSNYIYVADFGNNRIVKFGSDGNYLTQWAGFGSNNNQLYLRLETHSEAASALSAHQLPERRMAA